MAETSRPHSGYTKTMISEFLGSAVLTGVVVGSGHIGEAMSMGLDSLALLCNSLATAGALYVLILTLGPISGAHFNPIVTASAVGRKKWGNPTTWSTWLIQTLGCITGAIVANLTYSLPAIDFSRDTRTTAAHLVSEVVATAGLLFVITALVRRRRDDALPGAVAAYIGVAYFACSSTSFANPAITIGRMFTDTFAGIAPSSVVPFIAAQCVGGVLGVTLAKYLIDDAREFQ